MPKDNDVTLIKKYANRRLYNTGTSSYVTLEDLATMVKQEEEFVVRDARTGLDITHAVLTQIIFEQETRREQTLLSSDFLRQLIRFYGDGLQSIMPAYLEQSMAAFMHEEEKLRDVLDEAASEDEVRFIVDQTRRNAETFRDALTIAGASKSARPDHAPRDLKAVRREIDSMRERLDVIDRDIPSDRFHDAGETVSVIGK
ncbi:polyhydroxyalkanoate synthesis repressor PhaR [Consotaella aegiceratis]|uniref:polyhydroxyalkanoate synthesis repressor PhaR n=1 Tax=Consotaella aegiceratis TaxID=3097961 RepID=UPI002F3EA3D2